MGARLGSAVGALARLGAAVAGTIAGARSGQAHMRSPELAGMLFADGRKVLPEAVRLAGRCVMHDLGPMMGHTFSQTKPDAEMLRAAGFPPDHPCACSEGGCAGRRSAGGAERRVRPAPH